MRRTLLLVLVEMAALLAAGCAPTGPGQEAIEEPKPLPFDPTEQYTLARWWTDGRGLLDLAPDGAFTRYDSMDRYHEPIERGRWWQQSYAALWLEPYAELQSPRRRVSIIKIDGQIRLECGATVPLWSLPGAPEAIEDRLLGSWSGEPGRLRLLGNMRYDLRVRPQDGPPAAAAIAGHSGTWRVVGEVLTLRPDSPAAAPMELEVWQGAGEIILASSAGRLLRDGSE